MHFRSSVRGEQVPEQRAPCRRNFPTVPARAGQPAERTRGTAKRRPGSSPPPTPNTHPRTLRQTCSSHAHMCTCTPQALATFGTDIAIAFSGAEDVALIEYAHLTGRPYRVFRCAGLRCRAAQQRELRGEARSRARGIAVARVRPPARARGACCPASQARPCTALLRPPWTTSQPLPLPRPPPL